MLHSIIHKDQTECYSLAPLINKKGQPRGFIMVIKKRLWTPLIEGEQKLDNSFIKHAEDTANISFTRASPEIAVGSSFGFREGIKVAEIGAEKIVLHITFHEEKREAFSPALNLYWLLEFFSFLESNKDHEEKGPHQLFHISTMISMKHTPHGCSFAVYVSKACASLLDTIPKHSGFPKAEEFIRETYAFYGLRIPGGFGMQAYVREKGILHLSASGNCNCLGENPDNRYLPDGYQLHSHNTDTPLQQITLLIGLAQIWKELRERTLKTLA